MGDKLPKQGGETGNEITSRTWTGFKFTMSHVLAACFSLVSRQRSPRDCAKKHIHMCTHLKPSEVNLLFGATENKVNWIELNLQERSFKRCSRGWTGWTGWKLCRRYKKGNETGWTKHSNRRNRFHNKPGQRSWLPSTFHILQYFTAKCYFFFGMCSVTCRVLGSLVAN